MTARGRLPRKKTPKALHRARTLRAPPRFHGVINVTMTTEHPNSPPDELPVPRLSGPTFIVVMVLYTGFALPVSIVAMVHSFPIGVLLAAFLAWQWTRLPAQLSDMTPQQSFQSLMPQISKQPTKAPSGNASFDAYRTELMDRLEKEQAGFEGFLDRLRDAKDKSEFDRFMDERADAAKSRNVAAD